MTALEEAQILFAAAEAQVQFRTVISRAYFAVFNEAKIFCSSGNFKPSTSSEEHRNLFNYMRNHSHATVCRIGVRLGSLRAQRNQADYNFNLDINRSRAAAAMQDAESIAEWLAQVRTLGVQP